MPSHSRVTRRRGLKATPAAAIPLPLSSTALSAAPAGAGAEHRWIGTGRAGGSRDESMAVFYDTHRLAPRSTTTSDSPAHRT